ncbi:endonuclease/exonuclease/phosphatase family protein [Anaerobacillus sp. CMMVII]|uniref:endonuclease/exonuclease/phosphatase family protein n=1 Tax=Anaerobacillus sp. CMMVII TaxID=2755588 RepID=UPI0021B701DF|nr:endonuclease/exonuclease/phosphatase family protein [Anaerobacillus sp. CMMVII]MCT8136911.1 endonuclease/exonuclease/phosphatase family protein [Anaerobacillus sp. CMMVII]
MTYNIRHGRGLDGKVDLKRIADIIREANIDIIALNEVDRNFSRRSGFVDQAKWLANELKMDHVFGPALSIKTRQYGNSILSRLPIEKHENFLFKLSPLLAEPRSIVKANILIDNSLVTVLTSHFSIHPILHQKQVRFCLEHTNSEPCILMGDLNRRPHSKGYRSLLKKYVDCCAKKPLPTFPANRPRARLDYIFTTSHFNIIGTDIINTRASDHLPIVAYLTFH